MSQKFFHIAIDGPVSAGKSTIAKMLAERLGFLYVYTGAMYRAIAWLAKEKGVSWDDVDRLVDLANEAKMEMYPPSGEKNDGRIVTFLIDGKDVSWEIMMEEISRGSAQVAAVARVREVLVTKQQNIAQGQSVIMDGRDIGTKVLPNADLKIFLTGDERERARRQHKQNLERGEKTSFEEVLKELQERDKKDKEREADPLRVADGAWVLDTTNLNLDQVVDVIIGRVGELGGVE